MRTKTIIEGFKNSQKFRVIFKGDGSENDVGFYMTIKQMTEQFATANARAICWVALAQLSYERRMADATRKPIPTGLGTTIRGKQIQVDLVWIMFNIEYIEVDQPVKHAREIVSDLLDSRFLDCGAFAQVYRCGDEILKIFEDDKGYLAYLEGLSKLQEVNSYAPVINYVKVFTSG